MADALTLDFLEKYFKLLDSYLDSHNYKGKMSIVLIGGVACVWGGIRHATADIDFFVLNEKDLQLCAEFQENYEQSHKEFTVDIFNFHYALNPTMREVMKHLTGFGQKDLKKWKVKSLKYLELYVPKMKYIALMKIAGFRDTKAPKHIVDFIQIIKKAKVKKKEMADLRKDFDSSFTDELDDIYQDFMAKAYK